MVRQKRPATAPSKPRSREICMWHFKPHNFENNTWVFSCGTKRQQDTKHGYGNLLQHLRNKHDSYEEAYEAARQPARGDPKASSGIINAMFDSKSTNFFRWIEWIIMGGLEHVMGRCSQQFPIHGIHACAMKERSPDLEGEKTT